MGVPPLIYRLRNDFQELSRLMNAVEQFGLIHRLDPQDTYTLHTAIEEVLTDIILNHSENDRAQEVEVRVLVEDGELIVEITDDARPYNPLRHPARAMALAGGDEVEVEGRDMEASLGISQVGEIMDEMQYRPKEHGNLLILRKRLASN